MRVIVALIAVVLAALAGGALFVASGVYDVAATRQHTAPVYWLLETAMRRSVRHHARDIEVPPLGDPARSARGRALYGTHCVRCHGAPGIPPEPFALGLMPQPANLVHTAREWPQAEVFWVVKYGIRTTGMPAWEYRLADDDVWAIVAFLQVMANESPQDYRAAAGAASVPNAAQRSSDPRALPDARRGRAALQQYGCTTCHTIPGVVGANAPVGPPLARMGSRGFVAGVVPYTDANLVRWLREPQTLHPQSAMPDLGVTERDARDIAAFLRTLR